MFEEKAKMIDNTGEGKSIDLSQQIVSIINRGQDCASLSKPNSIFWILGLGVDPSNLTGPHEGRMSS